MSAAPLTPTPPPGPRPRTWQPLAAAIIVTGLWAVAQAALAPLLRPEPWTPRSLTVVATTLLVAGLLRTAWPRRPWMGVLSGLAAGTGVLVVLHLPGDELLVWLRAPGSQLERVSSILGSGVAPVPTGGALGTGLEIAGLLLALVCALMSAGGGDAVGATALVPAAALLAPGLVLGRGPGTPLLLPASAGIVLLVAVSAPRARLAARLLRWVTGAAALALACVLVTVVPVGADRSSVVGSASVPDLSLTLGQDLVRGSDVTAFSYRGLSAGTVARFTLAVIRDLDGSSTWEPLTGTGGSSDVTELQSAEGLGALTAGGAATAAGLTASDVAAGGVSAEIRLEGLESDRLPTLQSTTLIPAGPASDGLDLGALGWVGGTSTVEGQGDVAGGQTYGIIGWSAVAGQDGRPLDPVPVEAAEPAPRALATYTALPDDLAQAVGDLPAHITAGAQTRADQAAALAAWFHGADFVYDESAPGSFDDSSGQTPAETLRAFLTDHRGYCVHYASAFTVMARSLGLPTRIAVGYVSEPASAEGWTAVSGRDLHAWPEVWIDGLGWVAYEPTPGGPGGTQLTLAQAEASTGAVAEPTASAGPAAATATAPASSGPTPGQVPAPTTGRTVSRARPIAGALVPLALLGVLMAPALARLAQGRRRRRQTQHGEHPGSAAWEEVVATAVDLGLLGRPRRARPDRAADQAAARTADQAAARAAARTADQAAARAADPAAHRSADPAAHGSAAGPPGWTSGATRDRTPGSAPERLTRGGIAAHLARVLQAPTVAALRRVAAVADEESFSAHATASGPARRGELERDLERVVEGLRARSGRVSRLRARLLPASLLPTSLSAGSPRARSPRSGSRRPGA